MLINWVEALRPLTKSGWYWDDEGKFRLQRVGYNPDTPWVHAPTPIPGQREAGWDCGALTILHNQVFQGKAAPNFCLDCYKVVAVPETLEQVQKIAEWQHGTGWACKVGAERRPYTQRVWGAYFYCRGVEEGKERYKQVRKWIDENIGEHIKVFLKRACTEFEQNLGDSDKWEKIPHQDEIEEEFKEVIDIAFVKPQYPEAIVHHVWDVWDAWDKDNQPPVTYHEEETSKE